MVLAPRSPIIDSMKNTRVMIKGKLVDSGRRKLGVIMGDNVHTGVNSMLNAGATIAANSVIS
ncbi:MAG: hypothetical protein QMC77_03665 [Methanocellales archaeon]|nr:hypothetical protein [Methanocellales archaeon]